MGVWMVSSDGGEEQVGIRVLKSRKWLVALLGDTGSGDEEADLLKDSLHPTAGVIIPYEFCFAEIK